MSITKSLPKYRIVDLFSGGGGISRGFELTGRFSAEFGVEREPHPAKAFTQNLRNSKGETPRAYVGDIEELVKSETSLWKELNAAGINSPEDIHVLVGGPPCQGFSRNGVRKYEDSSRAIRFYDEPRNHLYKCFLKVIETLFPPLILIENVREFLNFGNGKFSSDLLMKLGELGYEAKFRKVCAADYGVPQIRHRVFIVGVKREIADALSIAPPFPAFENSAIFKANSLFPMPPRATVRDAISDLPTPVYQHNLPPP